MQIQRLNMDSSWWLEYQGCRMVVDPWLTGSEIDGFKWLNEQWHVTDPVPAGQIPGFDLILISQSYSDHCHFDTLDLLPAGIPIAATAKAFKKLRRRYPKRSILLIPEGGKSLTFMGVQLSALRPDKVLDPVYFGVHISQGDADAIFYCPHGYVPHGDQMNYLKQYRYRTLITSFTWFKIPKIMGGLVNMGIENVSFLHDALQPAHILNTHDEPKKMKGLVQKLANIVYHDPEQVKATGLPYIETNHYQALTLS